MSADDFRATGQRIDFHALNIDLDQVEAAEIERIQINRPDLGHSAFRVVDWLTDKLSVVALAQFKAAEAAGHQIIRRGDLHHPGLGGYCGMDGTGIEAIVESEIARQR